MKELRIQIDDGLLEELSQLAGVAIHAGHRDIFLMIVGAVCLAIDQQKTTLVLDPEMTKGLGSGNHRGGKG